MRKEIIIEAATHETRIAILEDRELVELVVERPDRERMVGDIFKGLVTAVLPGMQAAFVDIGLEKAAFLHVSDVAYAREGEEESDFDDNGHISHEESANGNRDRGRTHPPIQELLKTGQEILVQIVKEPIGTKGSRVTSQVSLPGRFLVLVPNQDYIGVSRKIENWSERQRLKKLAHTVKPEHFGLIVRTVAQDKNEREFRSDIKTLLRQWKKIEKLARRSRAPVLLHKDMEITFSLMRDLLSEDVDNVLIDSKSEYKSIISYLRSVAPKLRSRIHLHSGQTPIFDEYEIEEQIHKALHRKVYLKRGGYIVIDHTEALVTIDVNTGRYVGKTNQEQTAFQTNLEATREIGRQLRLRDIGGIIVIDFIDMEDKNHRKRVLQELLTALRKDRSKTRVSEISEFGLVEMTRQRVRPSLLYTFSEPCPSCDGTGRVLSRLTVVTRIGRWLQRAQVSLKEKEIRLIVHPSVAELFMADNEEKVRQLEKKYKIRIDLYEDPSLNIKEYRIFSIKRGQDITREFED